jgi:hypothetical protein
LLIDCTQAGKKCRTLLIGLAYHGTVLPIVWKTGHWVRWIGWDGSFFSGNRFTLLEGSKIN